MPKIEAKVWREMTTAEIIASMDIAVQVLKSREIDVDWQKLLLDIGARIIEIVNEECKLRERNGASQI